LAEDWVLLSTIKALQNDGVAILINLFGGRTYETPCFSPSLLLLNLVIVAPHPLAATECAAL
jgi:hypothetical protein